MLKVPAMYCCLCLKLSYPHENSDELIYSSNQQWQTARREQTEAQGGEAPRAQAHWAGGVNGRYTGVIRRNCPWGAPYISQIRFPSNSNSKWCLPHFRSKKSRWEKFTLRYNLVLTIKSFSACWAFSFYFLGFWWGKSHLPGSNSRPNVSKVTRLPLSYRGDRLLLIGRRAIKREWYVFIY